MIPLSRRLRLRRQLRRLQRTRQRVVVNLNLDATAYTSSMAKTARDLRRIADRIREHASVAAYERRIAYERESGLAYVRAYADRVRASLGLDH